ncbi:MAG: HD domain-containing protein [Oscillospiraceae bacterium]|nr:HD domain-containing protein [Oscillospiraceae bacterium]
MVKGILKRIVGSAVSAALFCTALPILAAADNEVPYVVTVYNENNGLPTGEANTVLQTSDGYIWIGSYGGLVRYDGTNFRNYSMEDEGGLASSSVRSLFEDSNGRLWIGTNDAGVFVMENDKFIHINSPDDRSFLCIRDFTEGSDGRIFLASNSGIGEIADGAVVPYTDERLFGNVVYSVAEDKFGRIWGAMNSGCCAVVRNGELLDIFTSDRIFKDMEIYCTAADDNGNIVLATSENEVAVLKFTSEKDYEVTYYNTGEVSTHNRVKADGSHILVSGLKGFAVINTDEDPTECVREFGERYKAMSVNCAEVDYENNIWLASSSYGVIKYTQGCFGTHNETAGLDDVTVNTVAVSEGYSYIGTDTGLIICNANWARTENELTELFEGIRIRNIIADSNGNVWIASYSENAVVCYEPKSGEITVYNTENGLIGDRVRVLLELSDGGIAVGTQTGVSIIKAGVVTKSFGAEHGMENTSILCFAEDTDGTLYAGSDGGGIYELSGDTVINHGFSDGLGEGVVLRMLKNSDGSGYFVSAGSSLYYWENGEFRKLTNFTGTAGSIFDFYDRDGTFWFMQNNGVYAVDKAQLLSGEKTDTYEYGFSCGLTGSLNANTWNWIDEHGTLHICTRNGISTFGFKGVENSHPKAIINGVNVDDTVYEHPGELVVESSARRITIDFAVLSYTDTTPVKAAYSLDGFDSEEIPLEDGKSGTVSYTNLPGGEYTFYLHIYNSETGDVIQEINMHIKKEKKLTEEPVFWILIVVMLIAVCCGAVMLYSRIKLNRIRRRQQEYKKIVEHSLLCFAKAIDAKDRYTNGHSVRVAQYSRELAGRMGLSDEEQENVYYVALLHDIGKIGIPDSILNKPERLTSEEEEVMKKHPNIGGEILKDFDALADIADGAKYHHERYDGKGYCNGLAGEDIPKIARIICVADTYDAMASDRCYRKALPPEIIEAELQKGVGTQFDPDVVPHMMNMIEEGVVPVDVQGIIFFDDSKLDIK